MERLKHTWSRTWVGITAMGAVCVWGGASWAGAGPAHDFTGGNGSGQELCIPCHTPYGVKVLDSRGSVIGGLLWNQTRWVNQYVLYGARGARGGARGARGPEAEGRVDRNSLLCMSCHDGTVASDRFGGRGDAEREKREGLERVALSGEFPESHPIGEAAVWPQRTPAWLIDPSQRAAKGTAPLRRLADGRMAVGCTSCHEPHDRNGVEYLLRAPVHGPGDTMDGREVGGGVLCMECHRNWEMGKSGG